MSLEQSWAALPPGARAAIDQQWAGLAAGGLPCGSAVVDASGNVIAAGRNHAYDPARTGSPYPLQHNRLAHAELNALALIATETDHATLTLWTTQHPCAMCAAALQFVGVGKVGFIADDPSDDSPHEVIIARRGNVAYECLASPLWWTICNLLFLYNSAVQRGENARNLKLNRARYPELVGLTMDLARDDVLGQAARSAMALLPALMPHHLELARVAQRRQQDQERKAMPQTYRGSCHCGRVTFELLGDIKYVVECNCSLCRRKGALWHGTSDANLRILTGEPDLALYQFNTKTARHYFCKHCGINALSRPRLDPSLWVVNVRCLDGVDVRSLPVHAFDGEHWEEAAKAFYAQQRKQPTA